MLQKYQINVDREKFYELTKSESKSAEKKLNISERNKKNRMAPSVRKVESA